MTFEGAVQLEADTEVLEKITFSMSMGEAVSSNLMDYQQRVTVSVIADDKIDGENGFMLSISDVKFDGVSMEACKGMQIDLSSYCREAKNQQYTSTEAFYHSEKNQVYLLVSNNTLMMNMMQENEYKMGQGPELMMVAFNPDKPENYEVFPYYLERDELVSVAYNLPDGRQYHYAESVGIYSMCKSFLAGDFIFTGKSYPDLGILLGFNTNTGEFQLMTEPTRALIELSNEAIENPENNLPANAYMNGYSPIKAEGNYVTLQGVIVTPEADLSPGCYVYLTVDMEDITKSFPSNGLEDGMDNTPGIKEDSLTDYLIDIELPEGYELGEFDATLGYSGGGLIGPIAYGNHRVYGGSGIYF